MALRTLDLGSINEPLLIFGGPYSNLQATRALRRQAEALGIPATRAICTGDVVAYCASPKETIAELQAWGCHVLQGNCEASLGQQAEDCGCGFTEGSTCSLLSVQWYRYASSRIDESERTWMQALPQRIELRFGSLKTVVVHGAVSSINRFIFASTPASELLAEMSLVDADIIIAGHSGIPFTRRLQTLHGEAKLWHNAGVIGMPANDGQTQVWYSLIQSSRLTVEPDELTRKDQSEGLADKQLPAIKHLPLAYPAEEAQARMRAVGISNGYADALTSGLWPSEDILPEFERTQRGIPIRPEHCWQQG